MQEEESRSSCCTAGQQEGAHQHHLRQRRRRQWRAMAGFLIVGAAALQASRWPLAAADAGNATTEPTQVFVDPAWTEGNNKVPPSFIGLSLEPVNQTAYYAGDDVFMELLRNLVAYRTGPINIRLGGDTQDDPVGGQPLNGQAWEMLLSLRGMLKDQVVYTVPINLRTGTAAMAAEQVQTMKDNSIPPEALYALAVGNEPNNYKDVPAGWFPNGGYYDKVVEMMKAVEPVLSEWTTAMLLSGPAIAYRPDDFTTKHVAEWAKLGQDAKGGPFAKVLTWHYYVARATTSDANINYLLSENANYFKVRHNVQRYSRAARAANLTLRIDETNTVSHSGTFGVSNTQAAALWVVDHALGLMQAGADGINLHGAGCSPYSPVVFPGACKYATVPDQLEKFRQMCPMAGTCPGEAKHEDEAQEAKDEQAPAVVNAPYFGMLFVQRLLRNHHNLTILGPDAIKVHGSHVSHLGRYVLRSARQLRVVLINKHDKADGPLKVQVAINGPNDWGIANVQHLLADELSSTAPNITVAGLTVNVTTGYLEQADVIPSCKIKPAMQAGATVYSVVLPPASATVLLLPHRSLLEPQFDELVNQELGEDEKCSTSTARRRRQRSTQ